MLNKPELDWVTKRVECSPARIFREVCNGIESDVARINAVGKIPEGQSFAVELGPEGTTIAVGQPHVTPRRRAVLSVADNTILVHLDGVENDWKVSVCMTEDGRCTLRLDDGTEIEQWQLRRRALETLFFGSESCLAQPADAKKQSHHN